MSEIPVKSFRVTLCGFQTAVYVRGINWRVDEGRLIIIAPKDETTPGGEFAAGQWQSIVPVGAEYQVSL